MIALLVCLFLEPQVRVSGARPVPHLAQTPGQVRPKGGTTRLQPIKCLDYYGFPTAIITKLFPKSGPDFLAARRSDVGVQNISGPYVNVVERCLKQGYPHGLSGHNAGISESCWGFCHMSPGYEPGLTTKIFHLDIKDHVTFHVLVI